LRLRFTPTAFAQLEEITAYISARNPYGAARVHARIRRVLDLLCEFPLVGSRTDNPRLRRIVTLPYPYVIYYEAAADAVVIHAVRHGARDPDDAPRSR
jgi:plasmid stabilization system protein ParE